MVDLSALSKPFSPSAVSWRVGSTTQDKKKGMALAFIDARDVMDRLDEVCGVGGWQCDYPHANGKTVCRIGIKVGDEWVWKADGAGDTDVEAEKGALSDAFKRAAVRWGVGRYLYDLASPWVELEPAGRSFKIADREMAKLHALLGRDAVKPVATAAPPRMTITQAERDTAAMWIAEINKCHSVADLESLRRQPEFTRGVNSLTAELKADVTNAGKAHRALLENEAA